mgnify:CR=1 FL=1
MANRFLKLTFPVVLFACLTLQFFAVQHQLDHFSAGSQSPECELCSNTSFSDELIKVEKTEAENAPYVTIREDSGTVSFTRKHTSHLKYCRAPPALRTA